MSSGELAVAYPRGIDLADLNPDALNYRPPQVAEALDEINNLSQSFFRQRNSEAEARDILRTSGFTCWENLELPTTSEGRVSLNELYRPFVSHLTERFEPLFPGLSSFEYKYGTMRGAQEGINEVMSELVATGGMTRLGILAHDYFGYTLAASPRGFGEENIDIALSLEEAGDPVEGRIWFISNPSAIDGNWLDDTALKLFLEAGHKVVLDAAYSDLTTEANQAGVEDELSENIVAVLVSPNKPNGLVHQGYPGGVFSRFRMPTLEIDQFYLPKDRLLKTIELGRRFPLHWLATQARPTQLEIVNTLNKAIQGEAAVVPSDAVLMAHAKRALPPKYEHLRRGAGRYAMRLSQVFESMHATA